MLGYPSRGRCAAVLVTALLVGRASRAQAGPQAESNEPEPVLAASVAQSLFMEGREAFERGDFEQAESLFRQSLHLERAPGTLLNLALSAKAIGKLSEAWQHAHELIDTLPPQDDRLPLARQLVLELDQRLPRLRISITPGMPADTSVELDGVRLKGLLLGALIPVNPGTHHLVVRASGRQPKTVALTVAEGQIETQVLSAGDPVVPPAPRKPPVLSAPSEPSHVPALRTAGIAGLVVGGASTTASLILGGFVLARKGTVLDHCNPSCDDVAFAAAEEGKLLSTASTATFVAGSALTVGGVILLVVALSQEPTSVAPLDFQRQAFLPPLGFVF